MSNKEPKRDGGVTQERIFGTGEETGPTRRSPAEQARRAVDFYVRTPLAIAWSDWRTRIGGIGIVIYLLMATVGVMFYPEPTLNEVDYFVAPFQTMQAPLGSDHLGRDVLAMTIHGTPEMLKIVLAGFTFAVGLGILAGMVSGYKGGVLDTAVMTLADVFIVLPGLPLIIVLVAIFSPQDPFVIGVVLSINRWPGLARELRSQVLALRSEDFVEAARAIGLSSPTIIGQELLPMVGPYTLIRGTQQAVGVIGAAVGLYFLGILPYNGQNWGVMLQNAYSQAGAIQTPSRAFLFIIPVIALGGLTFSFIMFSQGMDRVFNPRLRARNEGGSREEEGGDDDGGFF